MHNEHRPQLLKSIPMDPDEFRDFDFDLTSRTKSEGQANVDDLLPRTSIHVHWGSLPRPNHRTGSIDHSYTGEQALVSSKRSAYTTNAQRRATHIYAIRDLDSDQRPLMMQASLGRRKDPAPGFSQVKWLDDPHPGVRIPVNVYEGESVSPRSSTIVIPIWGVDMDAQLFRARVQPSRVTGRRRPGMTATQAKIMRNPGAARDAARTRRESDNCAVQ